MFSILTTVTMIVNRDDHQFINHNHVIYTAVDKEKPIHNSRCDCLESRLFVLISLCRQYISSPVINSSISQYFEKGKTKICLKCASSPTNKLRALSLLVHLLACPYVCLSTSKCPNLSIQISHSTFHQANC